MSRLYLLPLGVGPRRELKLPLGIVSGLEFSPDGKRLGFTLARPDSPSDAYSLKLSDGELTRWTFSEVGGLNPELFVAPTRIQFKSFDGRMIPAWLYKPKQPARAKLPVVVSIHGGAYDLPEAVRRELPTIPGDVPNLLRAPAGCVFAPRCPKVFDPCTTQHPADYEISSGHVARCHLLGALPS